jgi:hypothetical protein
VLRDRMLISAAEGKESRRASLTAETVLTLAGMAWATPFAGDVVVYDNKLGDCKPCQVST